MLLSFSLLFIELLMLLSFSSLFFSLINEHIEKLSLKGSIFSFISLDSLFNSNGTIFFSVEYFWSSKLGKSNPKVGLLIWISLLFNVWLNFGVENINLFSAWKLS